MAEDAISAINKAETLIIIGAVAVGGYLLYVFYDDVQSFIKDLFGVQGDLPGTYTGAAATAAQHPVTTLEVILGVGPYGNQGSKSSWNPQLQLCTGDTVQDLIDQGYSDDQIGKVVTYCTQKGQPPKTVTA